MFGWNLPSGRQQFWIKIIWPLFFCSLFAVRSLVFMSNYPIYNNPFASSHLMIHFGISLNQQQTKRKKRIVDIITISLEKLWQVWVPKTLIDWNGNTNLRSFKRVVHKWRHEYCDPFPTPSKNKLYIDCLYIENYQSLNFDFSFFQILENLFPCSIITPLDCFWEGSKLLGPDYPVHIP